MMDGIKDKKETRLLLLRWDDENMLCRCFHFRKKVLSRSEGTKARGLGLCCLTASKLEVTNTQHFD